MRFAIWLGCSALVFGCLGASLFSCAGGSDGSTRGTGGSSSGTGTSGTASGGVCDTGVFGSLAVGATSDQQNTCLACAKCSQTDQCASQWQAYGADPQYELYANCNKACASGDSVCLSKCSTLYPNAEAAFQLALGCSICQECPKNCDASFSCM